MYLIMRMRKGKLVINTVEKHSRMFKFSKVPLKQTLGDGFHIHQVGSLV